MLLLSITGCASLAHSDHAAAKWSVYEVTLGSSRDYPNALQDASLRVELIGPDGSARTIDGFWDGQKTWKFRFAPDQTGWWKWRTTCSDPANTGLHNQTGSLACVEPRAGDHGPLRVAADGFHLEHADGTPFYWLADTAWNGALRSSAADWDEYLSTRSKQRFTAIQFVSTQWRGGDKVLEQPVFIGREHIGLNPASLRRLDDRFRAIVAHGLVPAPVMLWALEPTDPGQYLSEDDAIKLARHFKARWNAYNVVWLLNGDGRYNEKPDRWRHIGQAVFGDVHDRPVTMHPSGQHWVADTFADQKWFDFIGYQSGNGGSDKQLQWLIAGPPAQAWHHTPHRPIINLEPNYEGHPGNRDHTTFTDFEVRRAAYWSQLVAPTAGVTYGNNPIWVWNPRETADAENHKSLRNIPPWRAGLSTPGIANMSVMRTFFESGPWWKLRPAPELIVNNPAPGNPGSPASFIAAASTESGDWSVIYIPTGGAATLSGATRFNEARWVDPRNGESTQAIPRSTTFTAPDPSHDWLLSIR
jgi:hypothetical protein